MVEKIIEGLRITGKIRLTLTDVNTGEVEISEWISNIIPLCGRAATARRLINKGAKPSESIITYGAVGKGTTTPANSNTKLGAEIERKAIASTSQADNIITIRTFFTTSEANGVLKEFGLFGEEATASADTGTLFERVSIDRTKTSAKTLLIESVITIS